ncbi:MAG: TauD/TfdA family dioxygenase [Azoarcus sp.]|jgi:alpha-ketoglutarate-dependent taurine dioxygenase|nr:TauD/TfdA family dioxygenase [Azoarcus sp.]
MKEIITSFEKTGFERTAPEGSPLPVLILPAQAEQPLPDPSSEIRKRIDELLLTKGAVLLRGFKMASVEDFEHFAASFGHPLLQYEYGSTPRTALSPTGVYTTTEYPAHQHIPLHNEQAYTRAWAMKAWFGCLIAAQEGGETPIADSRLIYQRVPEAIRKRFEPGILYVRNYSEEFDVPWQKVFNTDSKEKVEAFCRQMSIECEWKPDGDLRTRQLCQAVETHPVTGEKVWFNQAHLFHISNQAPEVRETLEDLLGIENVPRNTYFADGSPIPDEMLDKVRAILDSETIKFPWMFGDVMVLDNMLAAHARTPFKGSRKILVAMAEPYSNLPNFRAEAA